MRGSTRLFSVGWGNLELRFGSEVLENPTLCSGGGEKGVFRECVCTSGSQDFSHSLSDHRLPYPCVRRGPFVTLRLGAFVTALILAYQPLLIYNLPTHARLSRQSTRPLLSPPLASHAEFHDHTILTNHLLRDCETQFHCPDEGKHFHVHYANNSSAQISSIPER